MKAMIILLAVLLQTPSLKVKCTAFANGNYFPVKYTCNGQNISPALVIDDLPKNTVSLALIMDDVDSPNGEFDHWVMWNIPPSKKIAENSAPGVQGRNSNKQNKYYGPCPPNGVHTYNFKIYALDTKLQLSDTCGKKDLLKVIEGHVLASGITKGLFK